MPTVYATTSCVLTHDGMPTSIREGQPFDSDDAIVREFPWVFDNSVEQATAAPGERRTTRRKQ